MHCQFRDWTGHNPLTVSSLSQSEASFLVGLLSCLWLSVGRCESTCRKDRYWIPSCSQCCTITVWVHVWMVEAIFRRCFWPSYAALTVQAFWAKLSSRWTNSREDSKWVRPVSNWVTVISRQPQPTHHNPFALWHKTVSRLNLCLHFCLFQRICQICFILDFIFELCFYLWKPNIS